MGNDAREDDAAPHVSSVDDNLANLDTGPAQAVGPVERELTRTEARILLGTAEKPLSPTEFKRREKKGYYQSSRIDDNGRRLYERAALEKAEARRLRQKMLSAEIIRSNQINASAIADDEKSELRALGDKATNKTADKKEAPEPSDRFFTAGKHAEIVRRVFEELEQDEDLVRIVLKTSVEPDVVMGVHTSWSALKRRSGGFYVSRDTAAAINKLRFDGFPVASGESLLAALEALRAAKKNCERCKKAPRRAPKLCEPCGAEVAAIEAQEIARAAVAEALKRRVETTTTTPRRRRGRPRRAAA